MKKFLYTVLMFLGGAMVFCEMDMSQLPHWSFYATKIAGFAFIVIGLSGIGAFKDETKNW